MSTAASRAARLAHLVGQPTCAPAAVAEALVAQVAWRASLAGLFHRLVLLPPALNACCALRLGASLYVGRSRFLGP